MRRLSTNIFPSLLLCPYKAFYQAKDIIKSNPHSCDLIDHTKELTFQEKNLRKMIGKWATSGNRPSNQRLIQHAILHKGITNTSIDASIKAKLTKFTEEFTDIPFVGFKSIQEKEGNIVGQIDGLGVFDTWGRLISISESQSNHPTPTEYANIYILDQVYQDLELIVRINPSSCNYKKIGINKHRIDIGEKISKHAARIWYKQQWYNNSLLCKDCVYKGEEFCLI